jgi:hypothetical protein
MSRLRYDSVETLGGLPPPNPTTTGSAFRWRLKGTNMNEDWKKWLNLALAVVGVIVAINRFRD